MNQIDSSTPGEKEDVPVVGIGYSAGGLEAVKEIISLIPTDCGLAIVIISHLQKDQESHLSEILSKSSKIPVLTIENGMKIGPNKIFVIPPNSDVILNGNYLNLCERGKSNVHQQSIDFFFSSLSQNRKSRALGVVLSGAGSDGTLGLKAIKIEGGVTIVQDPKTATFDSMPRSAIGSGMADLILGPQEIGIELVRLARHPYTKELLQVHEDSSSLPDIHAKIKERSFLDLIFGILLDKTTVDFSLYKSSTIKRRIERQMMLRKIETIEKYAECLQKDPNEIKALYEDIFIHVTDFFRDSESFESIREKTFPEIVKDKSASVPIRIWVAGCATGEEAYSIAICLLEYLEENNLDIPINLFASDISEPALQKARKGLYAEYQMKNVSPERLQKYFEKCNDGYKIKKSVREICIFSRHDITSNPPIPRLDLVSCRNVLIYFSNELQRRLFPVFHYAMAENGFLWLGRAENPESSSKLFVSVDKTHKIFAKSRTKFSPQPKFSAPNLRYSLELKDQGTKEINKGNDAVRNADQLILHRYAPPSVLVDSNGDILQFRGRTVPYLEPSPGVASYNLLKMANPGLSGALRVCFQNAKKNNIDARRDNIEFEFEGIARKTSIDISPLNPSLPLKERQFLVVFEENMVSKTVKPKTKPLVRAHSSENALNQTEALIEVNNQLRMELDEAREFQQSLIEEYETSQEELTSTNEELRSTNEELQSTNEELHSTNEELGSAKEELQAANEELISINDEIQKRNAELEIALLDVEAGERKIRLMIDSVKDYAIFMLDAEGKVATWNKGARRIKGYEAGEIIGQHFSIFYPEVEKNTKPLMELSEASRLGRFEDEGWRIRKDGSRLWANVVITALRGAEGELLGFTKVTRDLTERREADERLRLSEERARLMTAEIRDYAIFMLDQKGNISTWNEGAKRIKGYEASEVIGSHFSRFYTSEDIARNHPATELQIALQEGRYKEEGHRVRKDGSTFWASVTITRINDSAGKLLGFAKVTQDLTEKLKMAMLEQTKQNEILLDQIFSEAPSFMCLLNVPDYRFLKSNKEHQKLIRKSDVVGKTILEVEPDLKSQGIIDLLDRVVETGEPFIAREMLVHFEAVGREPAKTVYLDQVYQPVKNAFGETYAIAAQGYEVTDKVNARMAIENERENFRNLFKQTPEMVCILTGPLHTFEFVNEAHVRVLGFNATGKTVKEAQPETKEIHEILDNVYLTGNTAELNEIPVTLGGSLRYFNLTFSARRDDQGTINGVMILGTEITDQVNARDNLKKAIESRDEFLSIASHELKTPLTSLQIQAQMRKRRVIAGKTDAFTLEKLRNMFQKDLEQVHRLTRLIDDMLDVTRISSARLTVRLEASDFKTVVLDVLERLGPQFSAEGIQVISEKLDSCPGNFDTFRIEQVVMNLLTNAIRYGKKMPIEVKLEYVDEYAKLSVKDNGIGIREADQKRIFEQFERAAHNGYTPGLGLGLYIVKQIVVAHEGHIDVVSEIEKGSTFTVEIPLR